MARDVAHQVLRPGAPVTAYLMGVAVGRGADPDDVAPGSARSALALAGAAAGDDGSTRRRDNHSIGWRIMTAETTGDHQPEGVLLDEPSTADLRAKVTEAWREFAGALADAAARRWPPGAHVDVTLDPTASGTGTPSTR